METVRLELKESWNKDNTGPQILQTLCAFANDLQNLNGGYIVIGVAEKVGVAQRPVRGLAPEQIDAAQRWIRGHCNRIQPTYDPVFSLEDVDGRKILVLWAPPSDRRPHQAPDARNGKLEYWVRIGAETVRAQGTRLDQLVQLTARVPFDDRHALSARLEDLREGRAREFLRDVRSGLVDEPDVRAVYRHARLSYRINDHEVPRNVALLFFTDDPEQWFPGARIEVAQFADDAAGNVLEGVEKVYLCAFALREWIMAVSYSLHFQPPATVRNGGHSPARGGSCLFKHPLRGKNIPRPCPRTNPAVPTLRGHAGGRPAAMPGAGAGRGEAVGRISPTPKSPADGCGTSPAAPQPPARDGCLCDLGVGRIRHPGCWMRAVPGPYPTYGEGERSDRISRRRAVCTTVSPG